MKKYFKDTTNPDSLLWTMSDIETCCKELTMASDISFQDNEWTIFAEGCYLYRNIKFCPFCGFELSKLKDVYYD